MSDNVYIPRRINRMSAKHFGTADSSSFFLKSNTLLLIVDFLKQISFPFNGLFRDIRNKATCQAYVRNLFVSFCFYCFCQDSFVNTQSTFFLPQRRTKGDKLNRIVPTYLCHRWIHWKLRPKWSKLNGDIVGEIYKPNLKLFVSLISNSYQALLNYWINDRFVNQFDLGWKRQLTD